MSTAPTLPLREVAKRLAAISGQRDIADSALLRLLRSGELFFVGGPWWGGYGYYDSGCWQWVPTRWGPQRIWVCGSYY